MASKLTLTVISEHQQGDIGDDWKYNLEAKVFCGGLVDDGNLSVAKHNLKSDQLKTMADGEASLSLNAGAPGSDCRLDLKLTATEVDLLQNDTGTHGRSINFKCPAAGESSTQEEEISVGVTEAPGNISTAVFTLKLRLDISA